MSTFVSGPESAGASRPESPEATLGSGTPGGSAGAPIRDRRLILAVLCVSLLLVSLDNTILNVALTGHRAHTARLVELAAVDRRLLRDRLRRLASRGWQPW